MVNRTELNQGEPGLAYGFKPLDAEGAKAVDSQVADLVAYLKSL